MQVEIKIDSTYTEPKIIIMTAAITEEINNLIDQLSPNSAQIMSGIKDGKIELIEQADLYRIYAGAGKVFAATDKGEYTLRLRLYEMEERLNPKQFVRISNSEIINLKKVKNFDLNFAGTICVELINGTKTYVSRRFVSRIKTILGI